MKPKNRSKKAVFKLQLRGVRQMAAFGVLLCGAVLFIVGVFLSLYNISRQNIESLWQSNTVQISHDMERYLTRPMDAVEFSTRHVEEMLSQGADNEAIGAYLIHETEILSALVDSNTTGIYGYIRGEYLDGSGWIPALSYEPTLRPWYIAAREGAGEISLATPFLNLQTNTMTMSVSRLLEDGESVISMDINLDGAQKKMEQMEAAEQVDAAMVLDKSGSVVTHSDGAEIGRNYLKEGSDYERELAQRVLEGQEGVFHITGPEGDRIIFAGLINEKWCSVLVMRTDQLFGSLGYLFVYSAMSVILVVFVLILLFLWVSRKEQKAEQLDREVRAAAEAFAAMYVIDLKADCIHALRPDDRVEELLGGELGRCRERMAELAAGLSAPQSRQLLTRFMALGDLEQRMGQRRFIAQEFVDRNECWMRLRYVPVEWDESGKLCQILLALESIDEERRQQEHLRRLAESDPLTRILNRSSGETRIRDLMSQGVGGMFLLLDVDHFKSVNDHLGHNVGDQVIVAVANCVRATFRGTDVVFRLGGDEFAAFAPGMQSEEQGRRLINRLFRRVEAIELPALRGRAITVSVGVAFTAGGDGDNFEHLYRRSDQGMYQSKQRRGNQATYV